MKKPIKIALLASVAMLAATPAMRADSGLTVVSPDGLETSFSFADVQQITFAEGKMMVEMQDRTEAVSLTDIDHITFDKEVMSDADVVADLADGLTLAVADGIVTVTVADDADLNVVVCALDGKVVANVATRGATTIDLRPQPAGVYIIKANNKLIKFTKQ